jgi:chaperonin cofactor prefoldin
MAKSKFEDVVNALLQRVDSLEKKIDDLSKRVDDIHEKFEILKASFGHYEQQEPEQPKRSSMIWR